MGDTGTQHNHAMTLPLSSTRYSTAVYSYTPPPNAASNAGTPAAGTIVDHQSVQAALGAIINHWREKRTTSSSSNVGNFHVPPPPSRWFLQVRTLRLSNAAGNTTNAPPRTMYMVRNASLADQCTLVIEDTVAKAVNISTVQSQSFDHFMSVNLLPIQAGKAAQAQQGPQDASAQGATQHITQLQASTAPRWLPRPSYVQIEGVTMSDINADFRLSIGMLSARGGAAGATGSSICPNLIIQLEYLPTPTLPFTSYGILQEYLSDILPKGSQLRDLSAETTSLDWHSLLGMAPPAMSTVDGKTKLEEKKVWTSRNTSWCIVKMCKEAKLL